MKNKEKKTINCDVTDCLYNSEEENECLLNNLYISSMSRGSRCHDSSSTLCQSFQNSGGIITDNEYEISSEFLEEEEGIEKEATYE